MTTFRKIATTIAALAIAASCAVAPAHANPDTGSGGAKIEDSSGTYSGGASIETGGTGSPDYTKPAEKPARGDYDTTEDYRTAVGAWEAGERGRIANLELSRGQ